MTFLGAVAVIAFLGSLCVGSWLFNGRAHDDESTLVVLFAGLVVFVVGALALQWRADSVAATQVGLMLSFLLALVMVPTAVYGGPTLGSVALATLGVVGFVGGIIRFVRSQRRRNEVGNPLPALVGASSIRERDGVQFAIQVQKTDFGGVLRMLTQNCFDGARRLRVTLETSSGTTTHQHTTLVELGPLAVVQVEIPVVVPTGDAELGLSLATEGTGGRRRRTWVAPTFENAVSTGEQVAWLALGVVRWGGGASFRLSANPTGATGEPVTTPVVTDVTQSPGVVEALRQTTG